MPRIQWEMYVNKEGILRKRGTKGIVYKQKETSEISGSLNDERWRIVEIK